MTVQTRSFAHHGHSFTIEADGWPNADAADAAIVALQSWALCLDAGEAAALHRALADEAAALIHGTRYDREAGSLPALRTAQRLAVRSGMGGRSTAGEPPSVTLEAAQTAQT